MVYVGEMNKEEMGISRVGSKVVGFVAVDEPLLDTMDHAAYHRRGDLGFAYKVIEYGDCAGSP